MSLITLLGLFSCAGARDNLDTEGFERLLHEGEVTLVDVRTPEEFDAGHLRGARNIDWLADGFLSRVETAIPKDRPLAVYCRSGKRSAAAAKALSKAGYTVSNLLGGYLGWTAAGKPVTRYEVETFRTPGGKTVEITLIKHGSLEIFFDSQSLQIDPVGAFGKPTDYAAEFPEADLILVTHEHPDHLDDAALKALTGEHTRLIINEKGAGIIGRGEVMHNGDSLVAGSVRVEAVPAYNTTPGRERFHPKGNGNGYILTLDGLRIYVAGDTEDIPEMASFKDIDIAFLPVNQPYTMTVEQCVRAAKAIAPKVLIPYHSSDTDLSGLPGALPGMKVLLPTAPAAFRATAADPLPAADTAALNARARADYNRPLRPGRTLREGRPSPFWNVFSHRFLYAPAFPFEEVEGADRYCFTLQCEGSGTCTFEARSPQADLSPVWEKLPVGEVRLSVTGLDHDGTPLGRARIEGPVGVTEDGLRTFTRDHPFEGPYAEPAYPYREAVLKGLHYIHAMPQVQHWLTDPEPDMGYSYYTYPCKIMGATIRAECLLARLDTACREDALAIARAAAGFLIRKSRPAGEPLAFFPPTYYAGPDGPAFASGFSENQGKTMMMEAISAGDALLDLYAATGERRYLDHALGIADTYCRHQAEDGSLPIKVDIATGEAVNDVHAMLGTFLSYLQRLRRDFGQRQYRRAEKAGDRWMRRVPMRTFDFTGQFEDVSVQGLQPYENLTNVTACNYASYLMGKPHPGRRDRRNARDLIALSEDQFVHWRPYRNMYATPSVFEQHKYQEPINSSTFDVGGALLAYGRRTGDPLALAKARALINVLVNTQEAETGFLPTSLRDIRAYDYFWMNCAFNAITVLRLADEGLSE